MIIDNLYLKKLYKEYIKSQKNDIKKFLYLGMYNSYFGEGIHFSSVNYKPITKEGFDIDKKYSDNYYDMQFMFDINSNEVSDIEDKSILSSEVDVEELSSEMQAYIEGFDELLERIKLHRSIESNVFRYGITPSFAYLVVRNRAAVDKILYILEDMEDYTSTLVSPSFFVPSIHNVGITKHAHWNGHFNSYLNFIDFESDDIPFINDYICNVYCILKKYFKTIKEISMVNFETLFSFLEEYKNKRISLREKNTVEILEDKINNVSEDNIVYRRVLIKEKN